MAISGSIHRFGAVFGVLAFAGLSQAALLNVGSSLYPLAAEPYNGSSPVATITSSFSSSLHSGTITTTVYTNDTLNPLGGLTFVYRVSVDSSSNSALNRVTLNGFGTSQTDASWFSLLATPTANQPIAADRDSADVVGFSFLPLLPTYNRLNPGSFSADLVVQTNAMTFNSSIASMIGGNVSQAAIYAPFNVIPTPGASALTAAGLVLVARRRRIAR